MLSDVELDAATAADADADTDTDADTAVTADSSGLLLRLPSSLLFLFALLYAPESNVSHRSQSRIV